MMRISPWHLGQAMGLKLFMAGQKAAEAAGDKREIPDQGAQGRTAE